MALAANGTILQVGNAGTPELFTDVAEVFSLAGPDQSRTVIDVTSLLDEGKAFLVDVPESGEVSLDIRYDPDQATHQTIIDLLTSGVQTSFRISWPDFGTALEATVVAGTDTWTTAAAHGYTTAQPIRFTNAGGALPASTPQIVAGRTYYARSTGDDTFTVYLTAAAAVAGGADKIDFTGAGTGTHSVARGEMWTFEAFVAGAEPKAPEHDALSATLRLRITGAADVT